jgi:hypothetical protein
MLTTALINVLGVATWYLLGIAYVSTASRLWPAKEQFRSKWLPWDVRESMEADPDSRHLFAYSAAILRIVIPLAFVMVLTIWPVLIYIHAKRGFRTKPGNHAE